MEVPVEKIVVSAFRWLVGLFTLALLLASVGLLGLSIYHWAATAEWRHPSVLDWLTEFFGMGVLDGWLGIRNVLAATPTWIAGLVICFFALLLLAD